MKDSCFFLIRIVYDADKSRTKQPVADAVAAANLIQDLVIGQIGAIDTLERFVHARIEARSHRFHLGYIERAQHLVHLLEDEFDSGAQLLYGCGRSQSQPKIIEDRQKLFHRTRNCKVAEVRALSRLALAGVLKLCLQARETVYRLVALRLEAFKLELRLRFCAAGVGWILVLDPGCGRIDGLFARIAILPIVGSIGKFA